MHYASFGRLKYIHVSIDTFSGAVFASAHMDKKAKDVKRHFLLAFSTLGIPQTIKTDNSPACTSKKFQGISGPMGNTELAYPTPQQGSLLLKGGTKP